MVSIRVAKPDDADNLAAVHITAWQETYRGIVPDAFLDNLSIERRAEYWKASLANPNDDYHRVLAAEVDGQMVGFANYGFSQSTDSAYRGELFAIYILKFAHGQGIGKALLSRTVSGLLALDLNSMEVWGLKDNPSRGFYEKMGGLYLREKVIEIGGRDLIEVAYGWQNLRRWQGG